MSGIQAAGIALAAIPLILTGYARFKDIREIITCRSLDDSLQHAQTCRPVCRFGYWQRLFLRLAFPDALDLIDRIDKDVIQNGTPHAATITRDLMRAKYNMTAVAVSVFHLALW